MSQLPPPSPPDAWYCPITREIFRDPVIGSDGHTYEREAIVAWLQTNHSSPITRQPMETTALVPNYALRSTIQDSLGDRINSIPPKPPKQLAPVMSEENLSVDVGWVQNPFRSGDNLVHVSVRSETPDGTRKPCAFICVIDVSGSMGSEATVGTSNDSGFSRLDLVKHSLNTTISMLSDQDVLAIVSFSYEAQVRLAPITMDEQGKEYAKNTVSQLVPNGGTNLWDGLKKGLELSVEDELLQGKNTVLLLLTDGEPTINPPRGILPSLDMFLKETKITCTVHTFGFGYDLDSALLGEVSRRGNGSYAYIPDCSMVGTVFINFLSTVCATAFRDVCIQIQPESSHVSCAKKAYPIGLVQYGQSRDLIFQLVAKEIDTLDTCVAKIIVTCGDHDRPCEIELTKDSAVESCGFERLRARLIKALAQNSGDLPVLLKKLVEEFTPLGEQDQRIEKLLFDVNVENEEFGQIGKACSRDDWYQRWGRHYLLAVLSAHRNQVCNNFKDAGVQVYGGPLFLRLQKEAEEKFCSLPPPKPSCSYAAIIPQPSGAPSPARSYTANPVPYSMSSFYDSGGVCFHATTRITLKDGSLRQISHLKRGDYVLTPSGYARVRCVLQFQVTGQIKLAKVGSLIITPFHPLCFKETPNQWKFPVEVADKIIESTEDVFNLILDEYHAVIVDDKFCCTLGHGFRGQKVEHEFFGTRKVIECIQETKGWKLGRVLGRVEAVRDSETGQVRSWRIHELTL